MRTLGEVGVAWLGFGESLLGVALGGGLEMATMAGGSGGMMPGMIGMVLGVQVKVKIQERST